MEYFGSREASEATRSKRSNVRKEDVVKAVPPRTLRVLQRPSATSASASQNGGQPVTNATAGRVVSLQTEGARNAGAETAHKMPSLLSFSTDVK